MDKQPRKNLNPWIVIRWAFAVLVFAGTIGIAVDQVGIKEKELSEVKNKVDSLKVEISSVKIEARNSAREVLSISRESDQLKSENEQLRSKIITMEAEVSYAQSKVENARKLGHAEAILENLKIGTSKSAERPAYYTPGPIRTESNIKTSNVGKKSEPEPQPWIPLSWPAAEKIIKSSAIDKWKDDYSMVNHEIEKQTNSYQMLLDYNKPYSPSMKKIIAAAVEKWKTDYSMVVYEVKKQAEAKQVLNGR